MTIWVDASAGASGDMLLGALVGAGVPVDVLQRAVDAIAPEPVKLRVEQVTRNGFAATRCHVEVARLGAAPHLARHRGTAVTTPTSTSRVARLALRVFERLAGAEARAHGTDPADVPFHEVGALDAIADIVGASAGFVHLGVRAEVVVSPGRRRLGPRRAAPTACCPSRRPRSPSCSAASRRTPARRAPPPWSCAPRPAPRS